MDVADIEALYELSPAQQGMLFHTLYEAQPGVYFEQMICTLQGELNVAAFKRAWQHVVDRHPALRTAFYWEDLDKPLQVVHRHVYVPWELHDWRALPPSEHDERLALFLAADRAQGFELSQAPIMRLTLFQVAVDAYRFVWSHHHMLLDGWSLPIVLNEVLTCYDAFAHGREVQLAAPRPYRDYIGWLQQQDLAKAEAFWRQELAGFTAPTPLGVDRPAEDRADVAGYADERLRIAEPLTAALQALARQHGLTLNTLVQGTWALLLSRYSGEEDILFGATVAGRPVELAGVETMVGLFINTLPVRVAVRPAARLLAWLGQLQAQQAELRQYEYTPLIQIQGWSDVPRTRPLFESIVVFENYPVETSIVREDNRRRLAIRDIRSVEQSNYPLAVIAAPGSMLGLRINYDPRRFEAATITRLLGHLQTLLAALPGALTQPLTHLSLLTEAERQQLLVEWNATAPGVRSQESGVRSESPDAGLLTPGPCCIHDLFAAQAARSLDAVALAFDRGQGSGVRGQEATTRLPPPAGGGTEGGSGSAWAALSPQSSVLSPQSLTYHELNARANQLAHYLQQLGVGPEVVVGLCLERSLELLIGLLGILKAGGAYLPLDPAYPPERLAFMLADARAALLLTTNDQRPTTNDQGLEIGERETPNPQSPIPNPHPLYPFTPSPCHLVTLSETWARIARERTDAPASGVCAANLAYLIYTSGSTGSPKGVAVAHRGVGNLADAQIAAFEVQPWSRVLQFATYGFDAAVAEVWMALLRGATLVLPPPGALLAGAPLAQLLQEQAISTLTLPPAVLATLPEVPLPALRTLIVAGEACSGELLARWGAGRQLHNAYGPTEATVCATIAAWRGEAVPPIGRPIANTQVYLLDAQLAPVPISVTGELYIGGAGLARGYHRRPDLTAERFVPNPFARVKGDGCWVLEDKAPNTRHPTPNTRLYKTGDLARYRPDGVLEFVGRADQQIKLRGVRIEPGELEALLVEHPAVREAVVTLREDAPGGLGLVAYVVPKIEDRGLKIEDSGSDARDPLSSILYPLSSELRAFLKERLPASMLPSAFVLLSALPLTPSGKLDVRALPPPAAPPSEAELADPRSPLEALLVTLWAEVLGVERVGVHDDFFALGGHSLRATQLLARIRRACAVELPLRSLFEAPSVAALAERVSAARRSRPTAVPPPLVPVRRAGALPLSFAQQRLWFLEQLQPHSAVYNVPLALRLEGSLDVCALRGSLHGLLARHEVLRTTFALRDGQPLQLITAHQPGRLALLDLRELAASQRAKWAAALAQAAGQQPFDLAKGPLLRALLLRLEAQTHVLLLSMHHIVTDGWSMGVLLRELATLYRSAVTGRPAQLPDLPIQYADYAVWQRSWLQGSGVRGQGASAPLPPPAGGGTNLPPPAGGGTEGGRSQESDVGEGQTQNSKLKTQNSPLEAQLAYWKQQLVDLPTLQLPTDRARPRVATFAGAAYAVGVAPELRTGLTALSRRAGATLFMVLLGAWQILLARYSRQDDIVVGTDVAGRTHAETEGLIGFFVNQIVLRTDLAGNPTFHELLRRVREITLDAYAHQDVPFEQLVAELQPKRHLNYAPLFQVKVLLDNTPIPAITVPGLSLKPLELAPMARFDLVLRLAEGANGLAGALEYSADLFDEDTIARMAGHFQTLLQGIVADPMQRIAELPILTEAERQQIVQEWNVTNRGVRSQESGVRSAWFDSGLLTPDSWCFHQLFEAQAAVAPDAVAVVFDIGESQTQNSKLKTQTSSPNTQHPTPNTQHLTYHALNARANQLAHYLQMLGVGPDVLVGICVERSPELIVGMMGILKAGGAYVPLDPSYPQERLAFMLADSQAPLLLTQARLVDDLPIAWMPIICLDADWPIIAQGCANNPRSAVQPENLAYVIYTSGSTGQPKAVLVPHRGLGSVVVAQQQTLGVRPNSRVLQFASISFDAATFEIVMALGAGACLALAPQDDLLPGPALLALLGRAAISIVTLPPSALAAMDVAALPALRTITVAGEACPVNLVARWGAGRRFFNLYGPTEATIWSTAMLCRNGGHTPPIGRPIADTQIYVLDEQRQPVPIGVPGELHIGGVGIARGYLNRPDLTAERFLPNPFAEVLGDGCWVLEDSDPNTRHPTPNTRLYRTGDLARYRPDGTLEFLGRLDHQVKLRGFRIELGEIEATLRQHPAVRECAVVVREEVAGEKRLVAYVVPKIEDRRLKIEDSNLGSSERLSSIFYPLSSELRDFLKEKLPDYMVPAIFVQLEALPLAPSGKIDRQALPAPETTRLDPSNAFVAARTPVEEVLVQIWADVLQLERVGIYDNFFELGGHSLLTVQVLSRACEAFQLELSVRDLFEAPSVAGLAARIESARRAAVGLHAPPLRPVRRDGALPLSFAQQRLWFLDQLEPDSPIYNVPAAVRLSGPLDVTATARSLNAIVARHEALRTSFAVLDGRPFQVIAQTQSLPLPIVDLCMIREPERAILVQQLIAQETQRPFELARGPLLRTLVLRLAADDHVLLLTMHHIVSDGWSIGVLIREVAALYTSLEALAALPELPIQYADYAAWQRAWLQGSGVRGQGSGRQGDKETRRQGDKEQGGSDSQSPIPNPQSPAPSPPSPIPHPPSPIQTQLAYWKTQLAGLPALQLHTDYPRPASPSFRGASHTFALPQALRASLLILSRSEGTTLFMVLLAAFQTLLHRYTGQDDIVVGTDVANRTRPELEDLIGFFVNQLVLRTALSGHLTFREILRRVRELTLDAYAHQDLPFEQLVAELQPDRHLNRTPLFQVKFILQNAPIQPLELPSITMRPLPIEKKTAQFDLVLSLAETADDMVGSLDYSADLFAPATIARMALHFQTLLEGIAANPALPLADLPLLTAAERRQQLVDWNTTQAAYPQDTCIHHLFEAQVARVPDAVALVFDRPTTNDQRPPTNVETRRQGDKETRRSDTAQGLSPQSSVLSPQQLTYRELNDRADRLAHHLRALGVGREVLVGLCVERSPQLLIGLLGILKAGGAYLPLDPAYPAERLALMLDDAHVSVLVTQERLAGLLPTFWGLVVCLDGDWATIACEPVACPIGEAIADNLAYVIYTSGSTGKPKGVMVEHRGLCNIVTAQIRAWDVRPDSRVLQFASLSFDASASEMFMSLLAGATLCMGTLDALRPGPDLLGLLREQSITTVTLPPSALAALPSTPLPALQTLIAAGEACSTEVVAQWAGGRHLFNAYGPTEATIAACYAECVADTRPPAIGRPFSNVQIYLLDRQLQPVPIGIPGELYIGGVGLARGYLGRPDLTAERFVPNPFAEVLGDGCWVLEDSAPNTQHLTPTTRLYKTGDLARYRSDGNLEFLGRSDQQVKLRGYRVELGEIEAALRQHASVRDAVVLVREDAPGNKRLVAYVVPKIEDRGLKIEDSGSDAPEPLSSIFYPLSSELRGFLQTKLPAYMVPALFVALDALPLMPNGKLDRRALPEPDSRPILDDAYLAPRTAVEEQLARIWADVLRLERVGVNDNFFALGGDSILSIQIIARAFQAGLHITPRQMFQHQTIAALAAIAGTAQASADAQELIAGAAPLTPIQRWFFAQDLPDPHHYNQSVLLETRRKLDHALLEQAIQHLLIHHDALRLRFTTAESGWQQVHAGIEAASDIFSYVDLTASPPEERRAALESMAVQLQGNLDLAEGLLLRVALFDYGPDQPGRLLVIIHHLVVDAVSWRIVLEDLQTAYTQLSQGGRVALPPKTTSFKRWAERLTTYTQSDTLRAEAAYWLARSCCGVAGLPLDIRGGANTVASMRSVTVALDLDETHALLHVVPAVYRTQINDVLLTALVQAFASWTGERTLLIDLEGHGREDLFDDVDLTRTVGWYTIQFPMLLDPGPAAEPGMALKAIKEQLRAVPQRGIGYGIMRYLSADAALVEQLAALSAAVSFNYLGQIDQVLPGGGLFGPAAEARGPERSPLGMRSHLLEIAGSIAGGQLRLTWAYSANIHRRTTIERLAKRYLAALRALIADCQSPGAGGYTPSDFPLARLDQPTLDRLIGAYRQVEEIYPLAPMQHGILFHTLYAPEAQTYVNQLRCTFHGNLSIAAFRHAWQHALDRHPALRTAFVWETLTEPLQVVQKQVELPVEQHDWRGLTPEEQAARLTMFLATDADRGFELSQAPLMRLALLQVATDDYHFIWTHHHLLLDGWSSAILLREVLACYAADANHQPIDDARPRPYRDYIAWLQRQDLSQAEQFWRQYLAGLTAPTPLGVDRLIGPQADAVEPHLDADLYLTETATAALQAVAWQHGLTVNTLVQGTWALLLSRYSGEEDILFGATVAGRPVELVGVETMVGLFINTLPVRVAVPPTARLLAWLGQLQAQQAELRQYEYTPLIQIQGWSGVPRTRPLFESIVVFENYPVADTLQMQDSIPHVTVGNVQVVEQTNYALTVAAASGRVLALRISYDPRRFEAATITRLLGHLQTLLAALPGALTQPLTHLPLLTEAERQQLLVEWNATDRGVRGQGSGARGQHSNYSWCIHDLFAAQAARSPDAVALVFDRGQGSGVWGQEVAILSPQSSVLSPQSLTYHELNARANQLAHYLQALGVGPEVVVGLCLERSLELLIGLLGILKAGGAYLPLDPAYPPARLAFMLHDAQVPVIVTQQTLAAGLPTQGMAVVITDARQELPHQDRAAPPASAATADNLAYVIYTSGSTGAPKGVMVPHRALVDRVCSMVEMYRIGSGQRLLQFIPISFDAAGEELFPILTSGATLALHADPTAISPVELLPICDTLQITILHLPAAYWNQMADAVAESEVHVPAYLRTTMVGGERLAMKRVSTWIERSREAGSRVFNVYGPTETTITATCYEITSELAGIGDLSSVPIGRPIANTQVYLLDAQLAPVPISVTGELYIGGAGLARGYHRRPDLTAERFVPNPFARVLGDGCWVLEDKAPNTQHPSPNTRLYKTGDLARYRPDGVLEFVGRADQQIKLRGVRIEPGELEALLAQHEAVREAVVTLREDAPGGLGLVAYVVPKIEDRGLKIEDSGSDARDPLSSILYPLSSELRAFLKERLPASMLPSAFVLLSALPLTPSGKLDVRALPPAAPPSEAELADPRSPLEALLATLWAEVLGVERVGVHDDFFALGGHSLRATQLLARIRRACAVELPLRSLFEAPSVAALAERVSAARRSRPSTSAPLLVPVRRAGALPLSFAQQRLWFLEQLQPHSAVYNVPLALRLEGSLDLCALRRSLHELVARHEVLRTTFVQRDGQPLQRIAAHQPGRLPLLDLRELAASERAEAAARLAQAELQQPFDLAKGPLLRALLLQLEAQTHVLLLSMHHIVTDGWSMGVLLREVAALYRSAMTGRPAELPKLPIQYADYAVWQRTWLEGSGVRGQGASTPLPPPARGGTNLPPPARGGTNLPPPARGGTEGGRRQESDVGQGQTQNSKLKTQNSPLEAQLAYWKQQLADLPTLALPTDRARPREASFAGATYEFGLARGLGAELAALNRREGATLFMLLLAAFQTLLCRYSAQDDIVVGTPIANRTHAETEGLIGFFVNSLVLRTRLSGTLGFRALLARVREITLDAYAHQDVPFEQVVDALQPPRDLSRHPLFQVMIVLQNMPLSPLELPALTISPLPVATTTTKFDLTLSIAESTDGLHGLLEYSADLFDEATIARMARHFQTLLHGIVAQGDRRLADLPLLADAERHQLLAEWNATQAVYPHDQCIHELFAAQAARTPDTVGVVFDGPTTNDQRPTTNDRRSRMEDRRSKIEDRQLSILDPRSSILSPQSSVLSPQSLTYAELNRRANQLAHHLQALGVGPEVRVGICVERSLEMVVGLLGILKAGAAYVPLDPAYPKDRLDFVLADSQAQVLITQKPIYDLRFTIYDLEESALAIVNRKSKVVNLDADWTAVAQACAADCTSAVTSESPAYVIYTSGSTGTPKGVVGLHRGMVNRCHWMWAAYPFAPAEVACQKTSLSFLDSFWEIFGPLLQGIRTVIIPNEAVLEPQLLVQALGAQRVTRIVLVPSLLRVLLDTCADLDQRLPQLKTWATSGEALTDDLRWQFHARLPDRLLLNLYGSSELSADVTWHATSEQDHSPVSIGRPIANTRIYLLDRHMQPVPVGVPGELHVGGAGLARGYLNQPDLTAERFVPNPFVQGMGDGGWGMGNESSIPHPPSPIPRLYRTGDLARYRPDGQIEFLGRIDAQVKVRGFRIEPGEVEAALSQHPAVHECVVVAREDAPGDTRLVAYVGLRTEGRGLSGADSSVLSPQSSVLSELRNFLKARLPAYMVPAAFLVLETLPLTPSGKVDRRALPAPGGDRPILDDPYTPPRTPLEALLATIWAEMLRLERVGIYDNFFALGGDSIMSIQIVAKANENGLHISPRQLFQHQTIAELAAEIGAAPADSPADEWSPDAPDWGPSDAALRQLTQAELDAVIGQVEFVRSIEQDEHE